MDCSGVATATHYAVVCCVYYIDRRGTNTLEYMYIYYICMLTVAKMGAQVKLWRTWTMFLFEYFLIFFLFNASRSLRILQYSATRGTHHECISSYTIHTHTHTQLHMAIRAIQLNAARATWFWFCKCKKWEEAKAAHNQPPPHTHTHNRQRGTQQLQYAVVQMSL